MEAVKSLNHKTTPGQYTIWWLKLLNLFWVPTLPLPHTSPWCISSFCFITIGRNSGEHYENAVPQSKVYSVEMREVGKLNPTQNRQTYSISKTLNNACGNRLNSMSCICSLLIYKHILLLISQVFQIKISFKNKYIFNNIHLLWIM